VLALADEAEDALDLGLLLARVCAREFEVVPRDRRGLSDELQRQLDARHLPELRAEDFVPRDDPRKGFAQRRLVRLAFEQNRAPRAVRSAVEAQRQKSPLLRGQAETAELFLHSSLLTRDLCLARPRR
jgi:hypothetical protein